MKCTPELVPESYIPVAAIVSRAPLQMLNGVVYGKFDGLPYYSGMSFIGSDCGLVDFMVCLRNVYTKEMRDVHFADMDLYDRKVWRLV